MVRSRDEVMQMLQELTNGRTDDRTLEIIEDVTDTVDDYETRTADGRNWQQQYNDLDAEWRERYRQRFFEGPGPGADDRMDSLEPEPAEDPDPAPTRFEELFS